jgi:putative glutathione S-transferase
MGMLIDGVWHDDADRSMQDGTYRREPSPLPSRIDDDVLARLRQRPEGFVLVASQSCPWSHGAVLTRLLAGFAQTVGLHGAGGPRIEGYALQPDGPLAGLGFVHAHQLYTATVPVYTGRATVPILWDVEQGEVLSNSSADIIVALDAAGDGPTLFPTTHRQRLEEFLPWLFEHLSNAVYRAGKAQRQDEYEDATATVYASLHALEERLDGQRYILGDQMSVADVRLFATLVRYDSVYATHFRCTRYRLTDFPNLWRYTRRIYQMPDVAQTVDFDEIRRGYYLNDGSHNPFGLVADQPEIDWTAKADL